MDKPAPAQIQEILHTSSHEVLFAVQYYHKANTRDPFAQYPHLHISLWASDRGHTVIITADDILCHFASTTYSLHGSNENYLAVISLSQVSNSRSPKVYTESIL